MAGRDMRDQRLVSNRCKISVWEVCAKIGKKRFTRWRSALLLRRHPATAQNEEKKVASVVLIG